MYKQRYVVSLCLTYGDMNFYESKLAKLFKKIFGKDVIDIVHNLDDDEIKDFYIRFNNDIIVNGIHFLENSDSRDPSEFLSRVEKYIPFKYRIKNFIKKLINGKFDEIRDKPFPLLVNENGYKKWVEFLKEAENYSKEDKLRLQRGILLYGLLHY